MSQDQRDDDKPDGDDSLLDTVDAVGIPPADATLPAPPDASESDTLVAPGPDVAPDEAVTPEAPGRYTAPPGRGKVEVGRGGIGRVLIAMDLHLGREIAVKELLPHVDGSGAPSDGSSPSSGRLTSPTTARFLREARVTGQLEHPNIVPVYELGQRTDGTLYYAMKLVRGRTLAEALARCSTLEERLALLPRYVDLCQAIAYAHSRGVIHRDIKTDNVMLGEFGETVVLDWGLAKVKGQEDLRERDLKREIQLYQDAESGHTVDGAAMGTPAYMSPEQARGDLASIDEQSDVWSLGAVLYELLTGRPPHTGRSVLEVLKRASDEAVTPVRERVPQVPPELAAVAEKALHRKRSARYASARELAEEVEAFQTGARVSSYDYSSWELLRRFVARNKALSASAAALTLVLLVSTVLVYRAYRGAERARAGEAKQRKAAQQSSRAEREARLVAQDRERDAKLNLALAFQEKANRRITDNNYTAARIFAAAALLHNPGNPFSPFHDPKRPPTDRSTAADALVRAQSTLFMARMYQAFHMKRRLPGPGGDLWSVVFFPDGKRMAAAAKGGSIRVWTVASGKVVTDLRAGPPVLRVAVSPDGRWLAGACGDGRVRLWDAATFALRRTFPRHERYTLGLAFSPDGKQLVTGGTDGHARIWEVATGRQVAALKHPAPQVWSLAYSPDGRLLASTCWGGGKERVSLWDVSSRRPLAHMQGHLGPAISVAFSPDGKELATGGVDKTVRIWSVAARRQVSRLAHHTGDVTQVIYAKRGPFLISVSGDRSVALWLRPAETVIASHHAHKNQIRSVASSPDGVHVATASWDGDVRLWTLNPEGRVRMLYAMKRPVFALRYTPRGDRLLAASERVVRIMNPVSRATVYMLRGHTDDVKEVAVSPDGRWAASASADGTVRLWDLKTRKTPAVLRGHGARAYRVAFSPDGKLLATGGESQVVKLWRVPQGEAVATLPQPGAAVMRLVFSRNGKLLATGTQGRYVRVWRLADRKLLHTIKNPRGNPHLTFAAGDRRLLITNGKGGIRAWDLTARKKTQEVAYHHSAITWLRTTPDRRLMVTSGRDNRVVVWDLKTLRPTQFMRYDMLPLGVDIRPDGKRFAVSLGVPIHTYPYQPDLWRRDPRQLLRQAQRIADLQLNRFRLDPRK